MAEISTIEWTDTTWNPVTGCTKISAGCDNCYAERFSERFRGVAGHPFERGFDLTIRPERLTQPLTWMKPRLIFVNSMSDLFHKEVPRDHIAKVFNTMEQADWHIYQVLTKRSTLLMKFLNERYKARTPPPTFGSAFRWKTNRQRAGLSICGRLMPPSAFSRSSLSSHRSASSIFRASTG
jgi:protein gp37